MGELTTFYAAADVAFVGGSLVRIGGHNLLEPVALGVPGGHRAAQRECGGYRRAAGSIAASVAPDGAGLGRLAAEVSWLLGDPAERSRRGVSGQPGDSANRGALDRLLALVDPLIDRRS